MATAGPALPLAGPQRRGPERLTWEWRSREEGPLCRASSWRGCSLQLALLVQRANWPDGTVWGEFMLGGSGWEALA